MAKEKIKSNREDELEKCCGGLGGGEGTSGGFGDDEEEDLNPVVKEKEQSDLGKI